MPTVAANGINIYYEIRGEGEPLVLIPGLATDLTDYERMIGELAKRVKVIAFDNRGAGRTDKPDAPYSIDLMADDTAALLTTLGIEPAHVLGISMGGRIAMALALRHAELVKSLILVATSARPVPSTLWRSLVFLVPRLPLLRRLGDRYPQPAYAYARQREASRSYNASDRLGEIHVPTLILHGKGDRVAPFQFAEELHAGIAGSRLVAFGGGHLFMFFRPKPFLDAVMTFLDSRKG